MPSYSNQLFNQGKEEDHQLGLTMELKNKSNLHIPYLIRPTYYTPPNSNHSHTVFNRYDTECNDSPPPQDIAEESNATDVIVDEMDGLY